MRARVLGVTVVPEQTVQLDLSVEEFALLKSLIHFNLDGISAARIAISGGLAAANDQLHPHWQDKVEKACSLYDKRNLATKVREVFA